uniref:HAT C-terminal dimerisation domain-containing protein n=1 Tax=Romanomermis culicivorax TaxID=13658 RepID=A0A915KV27_ROMCU
MKPIYEDITSDADDLHMEILEDITSDEEELIADEDLENITSEEEEETLNNDVSDEEGTILDYDDNENDQYKSHAPHSSDEEEIYGPVQVGGGRHLCFMQPVGSEQVEEEEQLLSTAFKHSQGPGGGGSTNLMKKHLKAKHGAKFKEYVNKKSEEELIKRIDVDDDHLSWWNDQGKKFPRLQKLACRFLAAPPTRVPSEQLFSSAGIVYDPLRNRLKGELVEKLLFVKYNLSNTTMPNTSNHSANAIEAAHYVEMQLARKELSSDIQSESTSANLAHSLDSQKISKIENDIKEI